MSSRYPAFAAPLAAAVVAATVGMVPLARAQDTVLWVGGTGGSLADHLPQLDFGDQDTFLGGSFRNHPFVDVAYPSSLWPLTGRTDPTVGASIGVGVANLEALVRSTAGPLVLAGVSQGAMVVQQTEALLNADPSIPSDTTFILIDNPNLALLKGFYGTKVPVLSYVPVPPPDTRFSTVVVVCQYDGLAQPVARPRNLLTVLNSVMGAFYVHPYAQNADLSAVPAANIKAAVNSQGGTTTTYLVPTKDLPLTMPLRTAGVPTAVVDKIDTTLRPIIDAGYTPIPAHAAVAEPLRLRATDRSPRRGSSLRPFAAGTSGRR